MSGGRLLYLWFLMGGWCLVEAWCIFVVSGETDVSVVSSKRLVYLLCIVEDWYVFGVC